MLRHRKAAPKRDGMPLNRASAPRKRAKPRQTDSRIVHSALKLYLRELLDDASSSPKTVDVYEGVDGCFYASRAEALMAVPDQAQLNPKVRKALAIGEDKIWPLVGDEPTALYRDGNARARERALAKLTPEERKLLKLED